MIPMTNCYKYSYFPSAIKIWKSLLQHVINFYRKTVASGVVDARTGDEEMVSVYINLVGHNLEQHGIAFCSFLLLLNVGQFNT